jgi:hypothetical protein
VLSQYAAIAAFTPEAVEEADGHPHQDTLNRAMLLDGLRQIGIDRLDSMVFFDEVLRRIEPWLIGQKGGGS